MPLFPPRSEPIKKRELLAQRRQELKHAIVKDFAIEKINKAVNRYRDAQLLFFKTEIHIIKDKIFKREPHQDIDGIEKRIEIWKSKTKEEIIDSLK